jgi:Tfp pilus assembly protein PilF
MVSGKNVTSKSNIYAELGRAYLMKKDIEEANRNITKSLQLSDNKNGLALEILGDINYNEGKIDKAVENWKKAQKLGVRSNSLQKKIDTKRI